MLLKNKNKILINQNKYKNLRKQNNNTIKLKFMILLINNPKLQKNTKLRKLIFSIIGIIKLMEKFLN